MFIVLIIVSILTAGYALRAVLRAAATLIRRQRGDQIEHELESAEPLSGNRMSDLATLRLIAQPVTSKTSTPMGLHWNGRATNPASKYAGNGGKTPHLPAPTHPAAPTARTVESPPTTSAGRLQF
jgi:hypothetical protein